jgi:hypothetical protein
MPEMQKPVLEHAAPKANQNQRLDGHLADEGTTSMQTTDDSSQKLSPYPCGHVFVPLTIESSLEEILAELNQYRWSRFSSLHAPVMRRDDSPGLSTCMHLAGEP